MMDSRPEGASFSFSLFIVLFSTIDSLRGLVPEKDFAEEGLHCAVLTLCRQVCCVVVCVLCLNLSRPSRISTAWLKHHLSSGCIFAPDVQHLHDIVSKIALTSFLKLWGILGSVSGKSEVDNSTLCTSFAFGNKGDKSCFLRASSYLSIIFVK